MRITPFPLHTAQQDIYTDQLIDINSSQYNIGGYITLKGPLNTQILHEVVASAPKVFDAFKIRFNVQESTRVCYFDEDYDACKMADVDFSGHANPSEAAINWMQERFNTAFELQQDKPLFEQCLLKISNKEHWFFGRYHHLMADGYGFVVWIQYMAQKYRSLVANDGREFSYPSYRQEIVAAGDNAHSADYETDAAYWKEKIHTKPEKLLLKKHHKSSTDRRSITYILNLTPEQRVQLDHLQQITKSGLQQLTIAALLIYFGKTSGQQELIFGIPVHKRSSKRLRSIVGTFTGFLPFKGIFEPDQKLADFLKEIQASQRTDYRHQTYLVGDLARHLKMNSAEGYLSDIIVNYEPLNFDLDFGEAIQARIARLANKDELSPLKIVWRDYNIEQPLQLHIHFSNEYFSLDEIELLAQRILFIIGQFPEKLDANTGSISILPVSETWLIQQFNNTVVSFPGDKTIVDLFEAQVLASPDATALLFETEQLTYTQLNERVNQLAHFLQSQGVKQEMLVPICIERSIEMIIGILGILKAGGAYVPIDPEYPEERLRYLIEDTGAAIVVSSKRSKSKLQEYADLDVIELDTDWSVIKNYPVNNLPFRIKPDHLAYVIYTSGSTGKPKGVCIMHRSNVNMSLDQVKQFGITDQDKILQFASISFDASVSEIFMAFYAGATLVLMDKEKMKDAENFALHLKQTGVSVVTLPPVFLKVLHTNDLKFLRVIITAGEAADVAQATDLSLSVDYYNAYGPTECAVCVSTYKVSAEDRNRGQISIGKPIANTRVYILNNDQELMPVGVPGELYVSGTGLAKAYLGLPQLTAEKFLPDPFTEGERMYRTGDIGRWSANGNIDFLGRKDDQIKLRGYRIEPGEIENTLLSNKEIAQCVVVVNEDKDNKQLVAYYRTKNKIKLWPSVAEFYIYDELLYKTMAGDEARNTKYRNAFRKVVKDKVILEIGPGFEAILSRIAIEEGAKKVYAVELLEESYQRAKRTVAALGLEDRIIVIHDDITKVVLPEKADYCISEIVGAIGGSEGSATLINAARHLLKDPACMIPSRSLTKIAAITLPEEEFDYSFEKLGAYYTSKIFQEAGHPFDLRLYLHSFPVTNIISTEAVFEDLDYTQACTLEDTHDILLEFDRDTTVNGFIVWLNLYCDKEELIDTVSGKYTWLPIYFPVFNQGEAVVSGDYIKAKVTRTLSLNQLNPDFVITGTLFKKDLPPVPFVYESLHRTEVYKGNDFYKRVFENKEIKVAAEVNKEELRDWLKKQLPEYMIPSLFIELKEFPVTISGKIDRKALPAANAGEIPADGYTAPRTPVEMALTTIWQELLEHDRIGVNDNFFELGGDSIITIQLVSRARQLGYSLEVGDVFTFQTIAALANRIAGKTGQQKVAVEQELLTGDCGLLPIQQWYLQQQQANISHYNQSVILSIDKQVTEPVIHAAIEQITAHHDALRFQYQQQNGTWLQAYGSAKGSVVAEDISAASHTSSETLISEIEAAHQSALDITKGELVRVVWIQTPKADAHNRLLIVIHHLAVDGVSWRILLTDLELLLNGRMDNAATELSPKTSSYRQWYDALQTFSSSQRLIAQTAYWKQVAANYAPLRVDIVFEGAVRTQDLGKYTVRLTPEHTRSLLLDVSKLYHTEINDLLLAALAKTICKWSQADQIVIGLEGHGREQIGEDIDTSRTVGWFTALYPVLLQADGEKEIKDWIISVKETLRQVPDKGLGYGVLKYLSNEASLQHNDPWDLVFNYLGQLDNITINGKWLKAARPSGADTISREHTVHGKLSVNSMVQEGALVINWNYSSLHYGAGTIETLAANYLSNLQLFIAHCRQQGAVGAVSTPSDFGLGAIVHYTDLDKFLAKTFNGKPRTEIVESLYPLSSLQAGILFHGLYDADSGTYISQFSCNTAQIDIPVFTNSWQAVMQQYSILRTAFYHDAFTVPLQCVYKQVPLPITVLDYRAFSGAELTAAIHRFETDDVKKGFNFSEPPLMRITLIRVTDESYRMFWTMHHILLDGWSMPLVLETFLTTYESLLSGQEPVAVKEDQYGDFIKYIADSDKVQEETYWRNYLHGLEENTLLPFIQKTAERTKGVGQSKSVILNVDNAATKKIQAYSQRNRVTVNTIMQGVWAYLLYAYTGRNQVVYGAIVSGRPDSLPDVEQRVGMYINTLPLYAVINKAETITEWLQHLQEDQVQSRQYQHTSLNDIQGWTGMQGDLFDSILVFENYPISKVVSTRKWVLQLNDIRIHDQNNYPLTIAITSSEQIEIQFNYNSSLIEPFYVHKLREHFEHVLSQLTDDTKNILEDIHVLTAAEKQQLQVQFNDTAVAYLQPQTITALFAEQSAKTPQLAAVVLGKERLNYAELNQKSNQLAQYLSARGIERETLVAVCMERSIEMIVSILGILKAGGAYLPVDPDYPADRISYLLEDSGARLVLSSTKTGFNLQVPDGVDIIEVDGAWPQISTCPVTNLPLEIESHQLAYVIYTSGSTGKPKGVMIEHSGVANLALSQATALRLQPGMKTLQFASIGFDASCYEIFNTLLSGGCLVLCTKEDLLSAQQFEALVNEHEIDVAVLPPSYQLAIAAHTGTISTIVSAGEPLNEAVCKNLQAKGVRVINAYGPTENTVCVTLTDHPVQENGTIVIGKPIANVQVYLLNSENELSPIGITGEICVAGAQVGRGYLNRPQLSAEKFVQDPFSKNNEDRMYRTGDLGRRLPDGSIAYVGRMDDQVKIRGFRIELGEIETVLEQSDLVQQAVVLAKEDSEGNKHLAAYVVPNGGFDKEELIDYLLGKLPEHMLPNYWTALERMPVTASGKIDRKALPDPEAPTLTAGEFAAPRNETEEKLVEIWKELLDAETISIHDNFFEIGGDSLLAIRLLSYILKELKTEIKIGDIFEHPTVALLAAQLQKDSGTALPVAIAVRQRPPFIPLSFGQERLWVVHQLEGSVQYHSPAVLRLKGELNLSALQHAFQTIVNRHEVLRTVFPENDGHPHQLIRPQNEWQLQVTNGSKYRTDAGLLQQEIHSLISRPFDLTSEYLLRVHLLQLEPGDAVLVVVMHHIASDAWSLPIMVTELAALYEAYVHDRPSPLPPLPLQYAEYALWQREHLPIETLDAELDYWKTKLDGIAPLQLPTDYVRPAVRTTRGASATFSIDAALTQKLNALSRQHGATLYMTLLATFNVLLYRYSAQEDVCVGTSIAGRPQQELEELIGFFVNTLALRNGVKGGMKFTELLESVRTTMLEAYAHQQVPFERVVEAVVKDRDPGRSPLFQVMLVLGNTPDIPELQLGDLVIAPEPFDSNTVKFDLTFFLKETDAGMEGAVVYSTDLFGKERIERMINHFTTLLDSVVKAAADEIGSLQMLSETEENESRQGFNVSRIANTEAETVVALFEKQALRWPASPAVSFEGNEVTYEELNERSNRLAHYLRSEGVKEDTLVPLFIDRGTDMITGILGILKAGGAYVPIDTGLPPERIRFMLQDTAATVVVCNNESREKLPATALSIIETDGNFLTGQPNQNLNTKPAGHHLAYIIYTSGSTGQPKGVMVTHGNLTDYVQGLDERTGINACQSFALVSNIATDLGNTVLYSSLVSGGTLHVFSREAVSNIEDLHEYFDEHQIDCVKIVPSHWKALMMDGKPLLPRRLLVFGGESLQAAQIDAIRQSKRRKCRVVNHYGPTETTVGKLLYEVNFNQEYTGTIPIGKPFCDSRVYVLSSDLSLCPAGVPGQLFIGGAGVAKGYLNNEALTTEKFIADPVAKTAPGMVYKTGDLVRYEPDGNIVFLGRIDDQVKIRGYRVEPGEVERVISGSGQVNSAVVLALDDKQGNKRLVVYVVADDFDRETLTAYLHEKLPEYMVPSVLVELAAMPLTANGKIDRKALPDPDAVTPETGRHTAPQTAAELQMAAIWEDVLEIEAVGIHDDFFELGGHSLLAIRLISAIRKSFAVEITIGAVFDHPTIAGLLAQMTGPQTTETLSAITPVHPRPEHIPLSFSQERLWFIDRLEGSVQYHVPAVLRLKGSLNVSALSNALQEVVSRHEVLRTVIKEDSGKPYQQINEKGGWTLQIADGKRFSQDAAALQQAIEKRIHQPYDLSKDNMLRASLFTFSETDHLIVLVLHHIVSDGWSKSVLVKELVELYDYYATGKKVALLPLPIQYSDYAIWQRSYLQGAVLDEKLGYWKKKLDGVAPLQLPADFKRPAVWTNRGAVTNFHVNASLSQALQSFSQQQGVTLFMSLITAFKVLLYRYTGQQDICVGTPVAGRMQTELESLIGFFVNTLALRTDVQGNLNFTELLSRVKATTMEAFAHQEVPFEKVVDAVADERDISRNPIFQVMFVLRNTPEIPALRLGDAILTPEEHEHRTATFDIQFFITETDNGLEGNVEYNTDLYKEETILLLTEHYKTLLLSIINEPDRPVGLLPMLLPAEKQQLMVEFNDTKADYSKEKTIVSLFEEQAVKTPELTAVVFEGKQLSYRELHERSNKLAQYLSNRGVTAETLVPICIERSLEMIVGILGILKAGGAYVPVDPDYPLERIQFMLEDIGANLILCNQATRQKLTGVKQDAVIELDGYQREIENQSTRNVAVPVQPQQLAYIIYTSGSTGKPKGVMIEHAALANRLLWAQDYYRLTPADSVLQKTTYSFDVSVWELLWPLITGARLIFAKPGGHKDNAYLQFIIQDQNITLLHFVPSMLGIFLADVQEGAGTNLKKVLCSGEALTPAHVAQFKEKLPQVELHNLYGPTEAAIDVTYWSLPQNENPIIVPIGKPVSNTEIYILDSFGHPVPVGVQGEIHIGGIQLARGYLNRPELTAERFIEVLIDTNESVRLYKTGDLGRWLPDGNVEYLRRMDDQVKIRGFRIELSEIETALNQLNAVQSSCIVAKPDMAASNKLVSYYVPDEKIVKEKEITLYQRQVNIWKELYESEYGQTEADENIDPEFNIIGWNDSFTGQPIPSAQMREWLDDIVAVLFMEQPGEVLEIGCGTGLIYYQLAGKVTKYTGSDLSRSSIHQIEQQISKGAKNYGLTELHTGAAHEVSVAETDDIDTVVLNSIIQYFPGEAYMNEVMDTCIKIVKAKGRIVIGDVRDYRLLPAFKSRLLLQKLQGGVSIREFNWAVEQEVLQEEELCFSPAYFYGLQQRYPQITHIAIQWKNADYQNELSLYRYTVVLYVGIEKEQVIPNWQDWNTGAAAEPAMQQLQVQAEMIALKDVPNPRLWKERLIQKTLQNTVINKVEALTDAIKTEDATTIQVNQLLQMAQANGYQYQLLLNEDPLLINIVLERHSSGKFISNIHRNKDVKSNNANTNVPLFADISLLLQKDIKAMLLEKLPEYMVPSEWVALGRLPLTINGKLDRKFLSEREDKIVSNQLNYVPPRNETEEKLAAIWKELLNLETAGIYDNFFELGGHSLLGMRLISAIRTVLNQELTVKDLFNYPTIAGLAALLFSQSLESAVAGFSIQDRPVFIPLSFSQERLWFIDRLGGSVQYHLPAIIKLTCRIDITALKQVFQTVLQRHEVLRTVILEKDGQGYQFLLDENLWDIEIIDGQAYTNNPQQSNDYIQDKIDQPFDLSKDYMLRARLIQLNADEHILLITMHHISADAWSMAILVNEVAALYGNIINDTNAALPLLPIQYADYAIWQRKYLQGTLLDKKLNYWKEKLDGVEPMALPTDYSRPPVWRNNGAISHFSIDEKLTSALQLLSRQQGSTLYMCLLAAFKILLHKYSGKQDICVGTSVANRTVKEVESLIGFFVNMLALRSNVQDGQSFTEFLRQVKDTTLEAYEHQDVPFEKVVDAVVKERDMSKNPLIQVMFIMINTPEVPELQLGDVTLSMLETTGSKTLFDLSFYIKETNAGLRCWVTYCTDLYREDTIVQMIGNFQELLVNIVADSEEKIGNISILTQAEQHRILVDFNNTTSAYPADKSITALFEEQAVKTPDAIALVFEDESVTYRQLNERSNRLAHFLQSKKVTTETLVPVAIERSIEMIVAILGILKAGGAYVPLNTKYPEDRLSYMLNDISAELILAGGNHAAFAFRDQLTIIDIVNDWEIISLQSTENVASPAKPSQLAYVIYTSGSTGQPKGVMATHQNVVSLVKGVDYVSFSNQDILLSTGSSSFDATTFEYWGMLLNGGKLILCKEERLLENELLKAEIREQQVNKMWFTATWFNQLVDANISVFESLETIVVGGEKLSEKHIERMRQVYPSVNIVNGYGPTENTTFSLTYSITQNQIEGSIPIGRPINNRFAYVLDALRNAVPVGVTGEIYLAGAGVTKGYLNNDALTEQKFVRDPFSTVANASMYRTGDLGCWLPDGNIQFQGRADDQVKIRGFRIEPGEIETVLGQQPSVKQCVVVVSEDQHGNKRLVAYVVPETSFDRELLISYLRDKLPDYMIPAIWMELDSLPVTANGKVDKRALPEPDASTIVANAYEEPRTEMEKKLAEIWQHLLDVPKIGIHDNFFELGGDSILAIQLVSRSRNAGYDISVADVFAYQTLAQIVEHIEQGAGKTAGEQGEQGKLTGPCGLLPIQQWYFEKEHTAISHFNQGILLKIDRAITPDALQKIIEQIVLQHDALRFRFQYVEGRWQQEYGTEGEILVIEDLTQTADDTFDSELQIVTERYHKSLNIEQGNIMKAVWIQTPLAEAANRLFLVIHHLAVDGVSWRILLQDLEELLDNHTPNNKPVTKAKGSSYRQWYDTLVQYGKTQRLLAQYTYWQNAAVVYQPLPVDREFNGIIQLKDSAGLTVKLGTAHTRHLIQEVPGVYHTEINDILLSALVKTISQWSNQDGLVIGLEGHGREHIDDTINISQTVGWFTSLYPLYLNIIGTGGPGDVIKAVKEQLRKVPDKGLGYGVMKYINKEESVSGKEPWDIQFNYLGQLDNVVRESKWLGLATEPSGRGRSSEQVMNEKLSLSGYILSGELVLNWNYSTKHYEEQTIQLLADNYINQLKMLIEHCMNVMRSGTVFTPSDFGLGSDISYAELDSFMEEDSENILSF